MARRHTSTTKPKSSRTVPQRHSTSFGGVPASKTTGGGIPSSKRKGKGQGSKA